MGTKNEEGNVIYLKISMDEEPESKLDQNSVSQQHQQFFFFLAFPTFSRRRYRDSPFPFSLIWKQENWWMKTGSEEMRHFSALNILVL